MTVAVAGRANASPPPVPALERPVCAAAKALTYLLLASMWVVAAGAAATAFIDLASLGGAYGMGDLVFSALLKLSTDVALFGVLLVLVILLLLVSAAFRFVVTDLRGDVGMAMNMIPREPRGSRLRKTAVIVLLASIPFVLLSFFGCLVLIVLSPAKGSLTGRIGTAVLDVGVLGTMVLFCFVGIPCMAVKLWRMSADSIV